MQEMEGGRKEVGERERRYVGRREMDEGGGSREREQGGGM